MDIWTSRQSTQPQRPVAGTKRLIRRHALSPVLPCPVVHYLSSESAGAASESHASSDADCAERVQTIDRSVLLTRSRSRSGRRTCLPCPGTGGAPPLSLIPHRRQSNVGYNVCSSSSQRPLAAVAEWNCSSYFKVRADATAVASAASARPTSCPRP